MLRDTGRFSADNLLTWYTLSGGVPKYLEWLAQTDPIIQRVTPVFATPNSRQVKYRIQDAFLSFWFRFIYRYRSAVEIENFAFIRQAIARDFSTYSGAWLEQLFRTQLAASGDYNLIGNYWEAGNKNEIDIVAVNEFSKTALIAEVKRNPDNLRLSLLKTKAQRLEQRLKGYDIQYRGFSLADLATPSTQNSQNYNR